MMNRWFAGIGALIEKRPFKTLIAAFLLFALLITGVSRMSMSTGNDTLVKGDNEVYLSNLEMEETFGGDSILVLLRAEDPQDLLSEENIRKMWNIEQKLSHEENILSFMSPASIIHQMTDKQSEEIIRQVGILSQGLGDMGTRMSELGAEMGALELPDPLLMEEMLSGLAESSGTFSRLIDGQNNLTKGIVKIQGGLSAAADGLSMASVQLSELSNGVAENPELKMKLSVISENIASSATGIRTMGDNTGQLKTGTANTSEALTKISDKLVSETQVMKASLTKGLSESQVKEMSLGFTEMGTRLGSISAALDMFHVKSGMMTADIPDTQAELDTILYDEGGDLRTVFSDVVLDSSSTLMVVKLKGNLEDAQKDEVSVRLAEAIEQEGFTTLSVVQSGKPVLDSALKSEMKTNMVMMVSMAVGVMLLVLMLVFKVRWRMLSLGIILVSVIATLGFMGILNVPITMVSMAVFPILIGLGIDYSIQFHNRFEEEKSAERTMGQIGKAVAVAVVATVLGFISLYASPVPMIQDFGKMLTIGVIVSFVGSVFLLLPILHLREKNTVPPLNANHRPASQEPAKETILDRILNATTKGVVRFSIPILILAVGLASAGFYLDRSIGVETDIEAFMPEDMEALEDIHLIRDSVGSTDQVVLYLKDSDITAEENLDWISDKTQQLKDSYPDTIVNVRSITTLSENLALENPEEISRVDAILALPVQQASLFINEERTESVMILSIRHLPTEELQAFLEQLETDLADSPMEATVTGKSVLDVEMVNGLTSGRVKMTVIGLVLVFGALLVIYRNFMKALIPILPVVLIIGMSSGLMYLMGVRYTPITATLGALVLGMGTEMTVMLMERYMEERESGKEKLESMLITVRMIGKAIVASGLTTIGGFSVLMASEFVILKDFGLMTVINISLALFCTFIILPPIVILADRFILGEKKLGLIREGKKVKEIGDAGDLLT